MKKIFTTLLMMGVALTGWANITSEWDGSGELKIVYHEGDNLDEVRNTLGSYNGQVKKLVLEGVFTNKNFSDIGDNIGNCAHSDGIVLDLSGCSNLVSKVVKADGTYDSDIDWVTTEHMFLPNDNPITVSGTATKKTKYLIYGSNDYSGPVFQNPEDEKFYPNESYNSWEVLTPNGYMYVDENGNQLPSNATVTDNGNETYSYEYTYTPDATPFALGNFKKKVIGLYLPNSENFNYVPYQLCQNMNGGDNGNLKELKLGNHVEWIGQEAFSGCTNLKDPVFPATMKVFAGDCFKNCNSFTKVDLSILPKIQIVDYMAFGSESTDVTVATSNLAEFILPKNNTSLKYFANYVVRGTKVTELDFSGCNGIVNFAHDGKATFGEFSPNWTSYWTFYGCPELTTVTLPRNLSYLTKKAFNSCYKLQTVVFKGEAVYENCELTNPLIIDDEAFKTVKDGETWSKLTSVTFSNNVTVIGEQAFMDAPLTEVTIPASIVEIKKQAFATKDPGTIKTITFEEIDKTKYPSCNHAATTIAKEAFNHQTVLTDVYVNCDIDIDCANWAFDHNVTFSQGNVAIKGATLHFPKGREAHYTNLEHVLTNEIAENPKDFQAWLVEHLAVANNGWQEFVNAGPSSIDPQNPDPTYEGGLVLRTFSDPQFARIVPAGLRAYIVNAISGPNDNGFYELTLKRLQVIPAETGVILFGQPNSKDAAGNAIISMTPVNFDGEPLRRDYWDINGEANKNYLMPIIKTAHIRTSNATVEKDFTTVSSYEYEGAKTNVTFRNFALNRFDQTKNLKNPYLDKEGFVMDNENYAGFFRIIPDTYSEGLAFLHLTANEYADATGGEIIVNMDQEYNEEYDGDGNLYDPNGTDDEGNAYPNPRGWWTGEYIWTNRTLGWGTRNGKWFNKPGANQFLGELEDADGIVKLVVPATNTNEGDIYNLQGVKVTNPTKGVYVRNGKKFVIK